MPFHAAEFFAELVLFSLSAVDGNTCFASADAAVTPP